MKALTLALMLFTTSASAPIMQETCNIKVVCIASKWYYAVQYGTGPIKFLDIK